VVKKVLQNEDKVRLVLCIFIKPKRNGGEVREAIAGNEPDVKFVFRRGIGRHCEVLDAG